MSTGERWVGWWRKTGASRWQRAVEADTIGEAARALTAFLRERGLADLDNRDQIITGGGEPRIPPRTTRRPRRAP
jgi:hypothetical protein